VSRWIRLNIDWDDSPWVFVLAAGSQLAWIKLLCHYRREIRGGGCKALAPFVAAKKWGVGEEDVEKMLRAAVEHGALEAEGGVWTITGWDDYQNPETVRKANQRGACPGTVPDNGGTVPDSLSCATTTTTTPISTSVDIAPKRSFRKPTVEQVAEYMRERGVFADTPATAIRFVDHYETTGWMVGKARMKNWQAAVRTWEHKETPCAKSEVIRSDKPKGGWEQVH
jgi:hypothetical protein